MGILSILNLKYNNIMDTFNTHCAICFEKTDKDQTIIITNCRHYICQICLCSGGYNLDKCPLCRKKLVKAFVYKNDKLIKVLDDKNCPHCYVKSLKKKDI